MFTIVLENRHSDRKYAALFLKKEQSSKLVRSYGIGRMRLFR